MSYVSPLSNASVGSSTNHAVEALSTGTLGWSLEGWVSSPGCSGVGGEGEVGIGIGSKGSRKGSIIALSSPGLFGM